jgi:predicted amino acid dehydrogenase
MFACCELGITPDVMTVAKALGGGLIPIGACLSTAAVYNADFGLKHTSTFAGNTLACRAGLATLDILEEDNSALVRTVAQNGARLKEGLRDLKQRFPNLIRDVTGRGYLLGLRFALNRHSVEQGLLGYLGELEEFTFLVVSYLLNFEGVRVGCTLNQGGVLRIEPPLTATWDQCQFFLNALERVLLVLERRDVAALTAQVSGFQIQSRHSESEAKVEVVPPPAKCTPLQVEPGDGRFAFLVHPLAWRDYVNLDATLSDLSQKQLATLSSAIADNFNPFVIGETRIVAKNGKAAYGEFILLPRRAEELKAMPREEAVEEVREAVRVAKERGARIVGLGAYTSIISEGGLLLRGGGVPALTTGNSFTALAARDTVRLAVAKRGWSLPRRTVAVVGAGGAIGHALCILLAAEVGRLILVGNPEHPEESNRRLLQVAGRLASSAEKLRQRSMVAPGSVAAWVTELDLGRLGKTSHAALFDLGDELIRRTGSVVVSVDASAVLPQADIVVCCTSSTERLIREENLRQGAVVCDVSRPSNVSSELSVRRPDVMILNGGIVRLPKGNALGFNASLPPGHAYACMAETMMLAIDQKYHDASLGFDLQLSEIFEMENLAAEHGFEIVLDQLKGSSEAADRELAGQFVTSTDLKNVCV